MRLVVVIALLLSTPCSVVAQASFDRVLVGVTFGVSTADAAMIECCALRTPPSLEPVADSSSQVALFGLDARVFWNPRTSTFVQLLRSNERTWAFSDVRQPPTPPFNPYENHRRVESRPGEWVAGQTLELVTVGRIRPWLFGAFGIRSVAEQQHETRTDLIHGSGPRFAGDYEWRRRQKRVHGGFGTRVLLGRRGFVAGEVAVAWGSSQDCDGCQDRTSVSKLRHGRTVALRSSAGVRF